jgi:hypothetical protein
MSATKVHGSGDLLPLSPFVLEMVYGDIEHIRSVFGRVDINRYDLECHYNNAKKMWTEIKGVEENLRSDVYSWLRSTGIRGLDYYYPIGFRAIWFAKPEDAFAFTLKFGVKDEQ